MAWQACVSYTVDAPYTEDAAFDLLGALTEYAAVGGVARDFLSGDVVLTVEAPTTVEAATIATALVTEAARNTVGQIEVTGLEVKSEEAVEAELARPVYPEVVGYAEIAEMGHVSRQAARAWADQPKFPPAVIETAQGPLRSRAAVEAWLTNRPTRRKMARV